MTCLQFFDPRACPSSKPHPPCQPCGFRTFSAYSCNPFLTRSIIQGMRRCPCFGPSSSFCVAWFRASGEAPMAQNLPLARGWKRRVRSSVLHILALGTTACPHQLEPRARRSVAGINLLVSTPHNASFHANPWTSTPLTMEVEPKNGRRSTWPFRSTDGARRSWCLSQSTDSTRRNRRSLGSNRWLVGETQLQFSSYGEPWRYQLMSRGTGSGDRPHFVSAVGAYDGTRVVCQPDTSIWNTTR